MALAKAEANPFFQKDFISIDQLSVPAIKFLFSLAKRMEASVADGQGRRDLKNKTVAELFYQPSTRTFTSFQAAAKWLGCRRVIAIAGMNAYSSTVKGESLADTIRSIEQTTAADLIILRHPDDDSSAIAASQAQVPVINAGSGKKEHPTQALLDLYTIQQRLGTLDHLKVAMVGDLKYGRTVKSLAKLLALAARGTELFLVAPDVLQMPDDLVAKLQEQRVKVYRRQKLEEVIALADVLYMTRIQKEWFAAENKMDEYQRFKDYYVLDRSLMARAKPKMIVMHPLPRVGEIKTEVDSDPRAAYFQQMRFGLYIRMALLAAILVPQPE